MCASVLATAAVVALSFSFLTCPATAVPLCDPDTEIRVTVGDTSFSVQRKLIGLISAADGREFISLPCDLRAIPVRRMSLSVSRTRAGDQFYNSWVHDRKLPVQIIIATPPWLMTTTEQQFEQLTRDGAKVMARQPNIQFAETKAQTFYRINRTGREPLFVMCSKNKSLHSGHPCGVNYHFGKFDVSYRFNDANSHLHDWEALDSRFRAFLGELKVH